MDNEQWTMDNGQRQVIGNKCCRVGIIIHFPENGYLNNAHLLSN